MGFALSMFATETPLANSDLPLFGERLDVYLVSAVWNAVFLRVQVCWIDGRKTSEFQDPIV